MAKRLKKNSRRKLRHAGRFELPALTQAACEMIEADRRPCVCIVGGGAAGMACALATSEAWAASNVSAASDAQAISDVQVNIVVLERDSYRGRTILASGNGRCNFSHTPLDIRQYHNAAFVEKVHRLAQENPAVPSSLEWFQSLGLVWREMPEGSGMLYPYSNRATAVTDVLNAAFQRTSVAFYGQANLDCIAKQGTRWLISVGDNSFHADAVVIACGGNPFDQVALTSEYKLPYISCSGVLGPLALKEEVPEDLDGLRADVHVRTGSFSEAGEVLFRSYGLSGIVAFNASRFVKAGDVLTINFAPDYTANDLCALFEERLEIFAGRSLVEACCGFIGPALVRFACTRSGIDLHAAFDKEHVPALAHALQTATVTVEGVAPDQPCQVQRGGVAVEAMDPACLATLSDPTLYCIGEALDVDGPCGGYNLDWAWTSGLVAGASLVRRFS